MTTEVRSAPRPPALVRLVDPIGRLLLRLGVPMGPDSLVTIRGRQTGLPRTVALAVVDLKGRRFVVGTYGAAQWVRNLRASGQAVVRRGGGQERVVARELPEVEAAGVLAELAEYVGRLPWTLRAVTLLLIRFGGASLVLDDPATAARTRPVFELEAMR